MKDFAPSSLWVGEKVEDEGDVGRERREERKTTSLPFGIDLKGEWQEAVKEWIVVSKNNVLY